MTIVVIGSGPAGVAAAHAIAGAGHDVTVLDAGDKIEPGGMDVFDTLARSEPQRWPPELARQARNGFPVDIRNVPLKPAYGSLFPYALEDRDLPVARENAEPLPSLAYGGLSNAWGASILPFRQSDIEDWPVSLAELKPHYEAVLGFMPIAAERDELSAMLPLYSDSPSALRRGPQAQMLLSRLRRHAGALSAAGVTFGSSRLAVAASGDDPHRCRYSGMCMYGCPYRSIYNASHTLDALIHSTRVDYRGGVYVDRLSEAGDSVRIDFHERGHPSEAGHLTAKRVFVACGAISSTRLILESIGQTQLGRRLQDSQYFVIPMLTARAAPVSVETQGNTLAQVFMELEDERISRHTVHLQLYGYNDLILSALAARLPLRAARLERALGPLLGRLVVIQGYLHSADSPGLRIDYDGRAVRLVGEDGAAGAARVRHVVRRLAGAGRLLGMLPMPGFVQVGRPGKGNHLGGSLPMRRQPGELDTDTLGRPGGWSRVHVLDASIFPSVPATTVTLSVMANAHRIATEALAALTEQGEGERSHRP
jgi:choline dehydrogenase-like flavoprotein